MRIQIAAAVLAAIMGTTGVATSQDAYGPENEYVEVTPEDAAEANTEEAAENVMETAEEAATEKMTEEKAEDYTQQIPKLGVKAGEVAINEESFPDEIFRSYVMDKFDANDDGVLSLAEIEAVTSIVVWSKGIRSLKGIEYFVNLINLDCLGNCINQLDVSRNVKLAMLNCGGNDLSQLDVSRNADLTMLSCVNNNLIRLDVSKNINLLSLFCEQNSLSQLDVSRNVKLMNLSCGTNKLRELDVSKNMNLMTLDCGSNRINQLDVSKNLKLMNLYCSNNSPNNIIIDKGQSFRLNQVAESSSNTKAVVIDKDSKVSAIRSGTAVVTVRDVEDVKSSYTVTVTEAGAYKITYKLNGGRNASGNPAAYSSKVVKLKSPTRRGYIFKGWYQTAKFKSKITAIPPSLKMHLTVYAKWEKVKVGKTAVTGLRNLSGKKAKVSIKKVSGAKGYEVVYSTDKRLKKGKKTITVKKNTATLHKLKKNKRYYVKCRAYKLDSTGKKVYGKYSSVRNVRIRK